MIKIGNVDVYGWEAAIRGARNPMNSWDKSDSGWANGYRSDEHITVQWLDDYGEYQVGPNDQKLLRNLANAGTDHGKFLRMITVTLDITAPLYWWKEFDTYKVGTVANSCSTMHKLTHKEFTLDDFSHERMCNLYIMNEIVTELNRYRNMYLKDGSKDIWYTMIQLLPTSYNQRRTVLLNYAVLRTMYHARKHHKLDEWRHFCRWCESLPYSELITGGNTDA